MRYLLIALSLALCPLLPAQAQISIGLRLPSISIGINVPLYPELVPVPGYPVYYYPRGDSNYFFYDGLYWVYHGDNWYSSGWYDGPWRSVGAAFVPLYVLRIPVRYYGRPPAYFRGWSDDGPPHWGEHWGRGWEERHRGWDRWDRREAPSTAPLPAYQRQYAGERYPREAGRQRSIRSESYEYRPHDAVAQHHFQQPGSWGRARPESQPRAIMPQRPPMRTQEDRPIQPAQERERAQPPAYAARPQAEPQGQRREYPSAARGTGRERQAGPPQDRGRERKGGERGQERR